MSHIGLAPLLVLVLATGESNGNAPAQGPAKVQITDRLAERVEFCGFDDPKLTLQDALDYLTDRYDLSFDVDEKAFAKAFGKDKPKVALAEPVANPPLPKMRGVTLELLLRKLLTRLDVESGATFLIHRNQIVITTGSAASEEVLGDSERPLPPLVHRIMEKRLLKDALEEVAEQTEITVLLDESVGDKAKETVSAKFYNTPIDTAVRVLADKANLSMVRLEKALYVTTHEKAQALRDELARERGERAREHMPRAEEDLKKDAKEKVN
jgi:hypothetical protein